MLRFVQRLQGDLAQVGGHLVESVEDREDEVGVDQSGGERRGARAPAARLRVVAQEAVDQPVAQLDGGGVPGAETEDDRHPAGEGALSRLSSTNLMVRMDFPELARPSTTRGPDPICR